MPARALAPITLALLVGFFACLLFARPAVTLPPEGFSDERVTGVPAPTALAFTPTPDARMLVTSKPGRLYVYKDGQRTLALNISSDVCDTSERGLLGVAVDPDFATNHYVYLYYTYNKHDFCRDHRPASRRNPVNRVSRFVMSGDSVLKRSEVVLIDNIPSPNGNHNGGDLQFGKDGYLYVSVGDGGCDYAEPERCQYENDASRDRHILLGKVLRIKRGGGIPETNPFRGPDSERCNRTGRTERGKVCQETFAMGFRNPFRIAFDPDAADTSFRINDVGGQRWEEIDEGEARADYGWNLCEGLHDNPERRGQVNCSGSTYTGPIHEYSHSSTGCESITGGAFVPNDGPWPDSYDDTYLYGDFVCNKIFELKPAAGGGFVQQEFATVADGGPITMTFGPHGAGEALYYTTFANGGEVRRIAYTGS
jgi:glucose/arabinose dehydrogenase